MLTLGTILIRKLACKTSVADLNLTRELFAVVFPKPLDGPL